MGTTRYYLHAKLGINNCTVNNIHLWNYSRLYLHDKIRMCIIHIIIITFVCEMIFGHGGFFSIRGNSVTALLYEWMFGPYFLPLSFFLRIRLIPDCSNERKACAHNIPLVLR